MAEVTIPRKDVTRRVARWHKAAKGNLWPMVAPAVVRYDRDGITFDDAHPAYAPLAQPMPPRVTVEQRMAQTLAGRKVNPSDAPNKYTGKAQVTDPTKLRLCSNSIVKWGQQAGDERYQTLRQIAHRRTCKCTILDTTDPATQAFLDGEKEAGRYSLLIDGATPDTTWKDAPTAPAKAA